MNPETKRAYIWSPPAIYNITNPQTIPGAVGSVRNSSGRLDYVSFDDNLGSDGDGRIEQVNTTALDNNTAVTSYAVVAPWVASEFMALSPQRMEVTHRRSVATSGISTVDLANDQTPTFNTSLTRLLPSDTAKTQFQKQVVPIDQGQRGKTDLFWARWRNNIASTANRIWRIVLQYNEVES